MNNKLITVRKWLSEITDKFIRSSFIIFLVSLGIAVTLFYNSNGTLNIIVAENISEEITDNAKLELKYDEQQQIVEGAPSTISVKLTGLKANIERFKQDSNTIYSIDVRDKFGKNLVVPVQYTSTVDYQVVITPEPSTVTLNVFQLETKDRDYEIEIGSIPENKKLSGTPTVEDEDGNVVKKISIQGASESLAKVDHIIFKVDATSDSVTGQNKVKAIPVAVDTSGNEISVAFVENYTVIYVLSERD